MNALLSRRRFVQQSSLATAALGLAAPWAFAAPQPVKSPSEKIRLGIMGVNGRGLALANGFVAQAGCEVAALCDVDSRALDRAVEAVSKKQATPPQAVADFRRLLDDKTIDLLVVAAPDHWHGPATILACAAKKHVYVEKPCCHTPSEGEIMVAAARQHDRIVTMGNQRRSWPHIVEAIDKVRGGTIGRAMFARGWYNNHRPAIGRGQTVPTPSWLNWELWQGPAPERAYRDNIVHYHWHWQWHWGTGELGNNGVHGLDLCRWGLAVDFPERVSAGGGKYRHDDDQETPDTHVVTYDFPDRRSIAWQGLSWSPRGFEGTGFGVSFHGEEGSLVLLDNGYKIYDPKDKLVSEHASGDTGDAVHLTDFLNAVREHRPAHSAIDEAYKSTHLCLAGNIAWRLGRVLHCDPATGRPKNDADADKLWTREYRAGWEPKA